MGFQASSYQRERTLPLIVRGVTLFLLLFLVPSLLLIAEPAQYLGAAFIICMRNATSLTTTFSHDLGTALQNLTTLASKGTKYASTTAGSGAGIVYAMFQCRGDQSVDSCHECMQNATARLPQHDCPNSVGALIQKDECYLRYDNQSFFVLNTSFVIGYCYIPTSDPVALAAIETLVENVTTLAPQRSGYFASASLSGEYAAAQCLGYLSETECAECLSSNSHSYRSMCNSTLGVQLHLTSCYYRFEPYSFLKAPLPPPPCPCLSSHGSFTSRRLGRTGPRLHAHPFVA